jgi:alcohol dehydrogenase
VTELVADPRVEEEPHGSYLDLRDLKVLFGVGCVLSLDAELRRLGAARPLVVVGASLARSERVLSALLDALDGFEVSIFAGARTHSPIDACQAAAAAARTSGADALVSLGGGSAVDVAKGASMLLTGRPLEDFKRRARKPGERTIDFYAAPAYDCPPVLHVSTTLSGAEFTGQAGLTWPDRHEKDQFYHRNSAPKVVVLDREMTAETPDSLWRASGVKCLDHCVERIYSVHRQPFCDALSTAATRTLLAWLGAEEDRWNHPTRTRILIAAWMAQFSTGNVNVGLDHAIGHQLGSLFGVGHGEAAAATLPHVLRFNAAEARKPLAELARNVLPLSSSVEDEQAVTLLVERIEDLIRGLGLATRLRDLGVDRDRLSLVAQRSVDDTGITGNPRGAVDVAQILEVLERAW